MIGKRQAVAAALGLSGDTRTAWDRIPAGITNHNWLLTAGPNRYFVKLHGERTGAYIDREAATQASRLAGEAGIGPALLGHFPDIGAEVYAFLDGYRTVTDEEMRQTDIRAAILRGYRTIHGSAPLSLDRTAFDQLRQRTRLARENGAVLPDDFAALEAACARVEESVAKIAPALVPSHNDSYAANFMIGPDGDIKIIDWEYAANNDPAWDLAMIALSIDQGAYMSSIVETYAGAPSPDLMMRVVAYGPVIATSWGLWAALQAQVSTIGFDYAAYSAQLFALGRQGAAMPAWEAALCR